MKAQSARVLVADPHEDTRSLYRFAFESEAWECLDASDGREALERALTALPSLLITELRLPIIDGVSLCRELRASALTERLPILVVTSDGSADEHARATQAGATAVMVKPARIESVLANATLLIAEARTQREQTSRAAQALRDAVAYSKDLRQEARALRERARHSRFGATAEGEPGALSIPKPITVLIADDDAAVRKGLKRLARAMSHLVVGEAQDGEEAVRLAVEHQPSVVVMDISIPLVDGIQATRRIRLNAPNVRVIVVTANMDARLVQKAFEAGADAFLSKPAVLAELPEALAALASGKRFVSPKVGSKS